LALFVFVLIFFYCDETHIPFSVHQKNTCRYGTEMLRFVALLTCGLEAVPISPDSFARVRAPMADEVVETGEILRLGPNEQWRREMRDAALGGSKSRFKCRF